MNLPKTYRMIAAVLGLFLVVACQGPQPAQEPAQEPLPTPEPVMVRDEHCSFTLTPPLYTELSIRSVEDCQYNWNDTFGQAFSVWVSHLNITPGYSIHDLVERRDGYQVTTGEQRRNAYTQVINKVEGEGSDCASTIIRRYFDVPRKDGEAISISAGVCTDVWERGSFHDVIFDSLDSFRPL